MTKGWMLGTVIAAAGTVASAQSVKVVEESSCESVVGTCETGAMLSIDPYIELGEQGAMLRLVTTIQPQDGEYRVRLASPGAGSVPAATASSRGTVETRMTLITTVGDDSYRIEVKGDQVKAFVNDRPVPENRIVRKGGKIHLMGEDGAVLCTMEAALPSAPSVVTARQAPSAPTAMAPSAAWVTQASEPPKVMLGVTMSQVDEATREANDLHADAILIDNVIEGLPASKAGIRKSDVIVRIEEKTPASQEALRTLLRERKPGEKLGVTVLRGGRERQVVIELEPYDAEKLMSLTTSMPDIGAWHSVAPADEARAALEKALSRLRASDLPTETRKQVEDARRALEEAMRNLELQIHTNPLGRTGGGAHGGDVRVFGGDPGQFFTIPVPDSGELNRLREENVRLRAQLDEMRAQFGAAEQWRRQVEEQHRRTTGGAGEDRLERLNTRLDRLEQMIEKLVRER